MAWYGGGRDYPPYVSVGEKRAHGVLALATLLKKSKRTAEPVAIARRTRQLTTTFWGKAWCDNLERYADFANRLPRGRSYLRNGSVLDLVIAEGRIDSLIGLLRGELSDDVLAVMTHAKDGLFPEPREMMLDCSCPDRAGLCKHLAAVLYGVGIRLDAKPELFFVLRRVDQAELLNSATAGAVSLRRPIAGKRIADDRLSAVFGIELEDAAPVGARRSLRRGAPGPSRVSKRRR